MASSLAKRHDPAPPARSERLTFADPRPAPASAPESLYILVVDDDPEVHKVTRLMLRDYRFGQETIGLLHAQSAAEARELLAHHPNVALVLLDVIMETDRAGLDLVRHIREELGHRSVRIVLRTGQPDTLPEQEIVAKYSIDDYVPKTDLTFLRVQTLVTTALRTYRLLRQLEQTQQELRRTSLELERLSQTDPLTGLWNRRRFDEEIQREWRRQARDGKPAAVLMIDVDYFKAYNDSQGHVAGDRALQRIAGVLSDTFRRSADVACRFGGEEFSALLPGMDLASAIAGAESLRNAIEALSIPHPDSPHRRVTVSVGCSSMVPNADPDGHGALLVEADQALYRAKNAGRNRVEAGSSGS